MLELTKAQRTALETKLKVHGFRDGRVIFERVNESNVAFGVAGNIGGQAWEDLRFYPAELQQELFDTMVKLQLEVIAETPVLLARAGVR